MVTLGKPTVEGIDRQYEGLLVVKVPLDSQPPQGWGDVFSDNPHFSGWPMALHVPQLHGSTVELNVPDGDLEKSLVALRKRVDWANEKFDREVMPALEARERQEEQEVAAREQRLKDAQRRLDEVAEPS
jgi:hypothetical protein